MVAHPANATFNMDLDHSCVNNGERDAVEQQLFMDLLEKDEALARLEQVVESKLAMEGAVQDLEGRLAALELEARHEAQASIVAQHVQLSAQAEYNRHDELALRQKLDMWH